MMFFSKVWKPSLVVGPFVDLRNFFLALDSQYHHHLCSSTKKIWSHTGLYGHPLLGISELDKLPIFCTLKVLGLSTKSPFAQILFVGRPCLRQR